MASPLNSHRAWIVFGLALACVGPTYAISIEIQLTPDNATVNGLVFKVEARDMGDGQEIEVAVTPEAGRELSPFLAAVLQVRDGNRLLLSCPVEKKAQNGGLRYRLYVSASEVGKVRFRFEEYAFAKVKDKDGNVKIEPMPSMDAYWLDLEDFVAGKVEPMPPARHAQTLIVGLLVLGVAFYAALRRSKKRAAAKEIPT